MHYVGKAATFILLIALPMLLLAKVSPAAATWAYPGGWGFAWWGLVLYWVAAFFYLVQIRGALREARA